MKSLSRSALLLASLLAACGRGPSYDIVVANGRVIDPESGLDGIRNVGVRAGRVEAISTSPLEGARVIDATGLVVAPGFIDLHEHGQQEEAYALMVRAGVTSALELEVGTGDVAAWYASRDSGQVVNYGVSVGHIKARMKALGDPSTALLPAGIGGTGSASEAQLAEMEAILRKGLADGAVAIGVGSAYTPGATMAEIERMLRVAAESRRVHELLDCVFPRPMDPRTFLFARSRDEGRQQGQKRRQTGKNSADSHGDSSRARARISQR